MSWQHYGYQWGYPQAEDQPPPAEDDDSENVAAEAVEGNESGDSDQDFDRLSAGFQEPGNGAYFVNDNRAYNASVWAYRFPADQEEVMRQDRQHYLVLRSLPGLYRGPVDAILNDRSKIRRVLDIGCGTGIWLAEMAEQFPHVDCVGIDLMPLQHSHQLANCTYMCVEAPSGLGVFPSKSFDVIHLRQMLYSLVEFEETLREAHRMLRPGGLVLIHEPQLQFVSTYTGYSAEDLAPNVCRYMTYFRRALSYRGIQMDIFNSMEDVLERAGFSRTAIDTFWHYRQVCPCDESSEVGLNETLNTRSFVSASRLMLLEAGELTSDDIDELEEGVRREAMGESEGTAGAYGARGVYSPWGYWVAQK